MATTPVARSSVPQLGIMKMDGGCRIRRFEEKPADPGVQDSLRLGREWHAPLGIGDGEPRWLASMGIYVFERDLLPRLLEKEATDFGRHIIPQSIGERKVFSYVFQGYWEDVGTMRAFFDANLELAGPRPRFSLIEGSSPIFTHPRFLPASKILDATIRSSLVADGCTIDGAEISRSQLGVRSMVRRGCRLDRGGDDGQRPLPGRGGLRRSAPPGDRGGGPSSPRPSSTRTRGSAAAAASRPRASLPTWTGRASTSGTASSSSPAGACSPMAPSSDSARRPRPAGARA